LHLGFVVVTDGSREKKLDAFGDGQILHSHLAQAASEVVGFDRDERTVQTIQSKFGVSGLMVGDVEHLERLPLHGIFDVIVFGNLIERLISAGRALEGIWRVVALNRELIISTPRAFSLLANIRFTLGRFRKRSEHAAAYSQFTLPPVLERRQFKVTELYTGFDRPPQSRNKRFAFALGIPFLKAMPDRSGTPWAVARSAT
jgi:SAM-dependent methyltransferase